MLMLFKKSSESFITISNGNFGPEYKEMPDLSGPNALK